MVDSLGFTQCEVDQAIFFKRETNGDLMIMVIHVDDCMIAESMLALVADVKKQMSEHVKITNSGELHWLLGIEVRRNKETCTISSSQ